MGGNCHLMNFSKLNLWARLSSIPSSDSLNPFFILLSLLFIERSMYSEQRLKIEMRWSGNESKSTAALFREQDTPTNVRVCLATSQYVIVPVFTTLLTMSLDFHTFDALNEPCMGLFVHFCRKKGEFLADFPF